MNYPDMSPTWGLRYYQGHFHLHLMWMQWRTGQWMSQRSLIRAKYKTLDRALLELRSMVGTVMIFPV